MEAASPPLPPKLPILPLRRTVTFPLTVSPLAVDRPGSLDGVHKALAGDRLILLVLQATDAEAPGPDDLRSVGTAAIIRQMSKAQQGAYILVEGVARIRLDQVERDGPGLNARVTPHPEQVERSIEVDAYIRRLQELVDRALSLSSALSPDLSAVVKAIEDPLRLVYLVASLLDMKAEDKQLLLEEDRLLVKLDAVTAALNREIALLEVKGKIESQVRDEMTDQQRQYYLRQQLKAIREELGETEGAEMTELRERVVAANLPETVAAVALREVDRLERMSPASPEYQMIRTYGIHTVVLPEGNMSDLAELSEDVRSDMTSVPARTLEDVLKVALPPPQSADYAQPGLTTH